MGYMLVIRSATSALMCTGVTTGWRLAGTCCTHWVSTRSRAFVAANSLYPIWAAHGVLFAEVLSVFAFAVSWFTEGWELFEYNRLQPTDKVGGPARGAAIAEKEADGPDRGRSGHRGGQTGGVTAHTDSADTAPQTAT